MISLMVTYDKESGSVIAVGYTLTSIEGDLN